MKTLSCLLLFAIFSTIAFAGAIQNHNVIWFNTEIPSSISETQLPTQHLAHQLETVYRCSPL